MPHSENVNYEFGPYRLNLAERLLTREGETIYLTPKATEILVQLVKNAGQLLDRDDLLREVWPNTFVEESNLTQNIFALRRALGDEWTEPKYIATVARRGYRFIANTRLCNGDEEESAEVEPLNGDGVVLPIVVAVLPFINTTGEVSVEYLAEGVTDNIINHLSRVSQLRVMSRSAVFRHKRHELDPQRIGKELGAAAVLVGTIDVRPAGIAVDVELVSVATGWQLWGESFNTDSKDLLEIQDTITRQLLANLKLKLTGEEEKRVTARYTENPKAYQAYLEGRYHWSRYTRKGIEKAIGHFREAIEIDPNYALAYAGIVDCYLRLATNYLPPEDDVPRLRRDISSKSEIDWATPEQRLKLRFEWDWKGVQRERRRANELKTEYPSPHQWYAAYRLSEQLYRESPFASRPRKGPKRNLLTHSRATPQIRGVQLTPTEEVQILCSVARDQIAIGNYQAAELILKKWAIPGKWPRLDVLNAYAAADLLFTAGNLFGWIAGSSQMINGHKYAEAFLNGAVALFEQLGIKSHSLEAQVELARCYYRQGLLDLAKETISTALSQLPEDQLELRTFALVVWGVIERDSGRLRSSLIKLRQAAKLEATGQLVTNRCYLDLATTLKELALPERNEEYLDEAEHHFWRALYESEVLGHHRNVGSVENNIGFLLLSIGAYPESEEHLLRSRRIFEILFDSIRGAQVNDTLARLYIETKRLDLAEEVINRAVQSLERTDSEAILAESLTTKGLVACRLQLYPDAKRCFEAAYKVAQRCGDGQNAARALLTMLEEMPNYLAVNDTIHAKEQMKELLSTMPQCTLQVRIEQYVGQDMCQSTLGIRENPVIPKEK